LKKKLLTNTFEYDKINKFRFESGGNVLLQELKKLLQKKLKKFLTSENECDKIVKSLW